MWELLAAFLGGGLAGLVSATIAVRRLHSENVIGERQKWREKLREIAVELGSGEITDHVWIDLKTRLNPFSEDERSIIRTIQQSRGEKLSDSELASCVETLSIILKHDWERAKIESSIWPFGASDRAWRRIGHSSKLLADRERRMLENAET